MDLTIIISVSGKPGLYKVVGQTRTGLIAQSLVDEKRIPVRSTDKVSALSDISIFTYEEDLPLAEVLQKMHLHYDGKNTPDQLNDGKWMGDELRSVIENYDEARVYTSDLKKLFKWYNLLNEQGLVDQEVEGEKEAEEEPTPAKETEEKKPAKAKAKPKAKKTDKAEPKAKKTGKADSKE